ncbi:Oidioi.mRNA.OKI2018_I69.XSR.g15166.t1.cds [Oikopleura dioica]|uniref:Oidioi.mRNA.OKI2018_I69.XSR.g15166.t1.cds n=1 Tax=Oikopleura dioica TaxID=34765 RepID=A0ABN7SIC5_OIKDI|nr:Oidioi.mRNA.OKI2018_I69.XSR.g15166.t1.cds [Oikopleura dioica]
MENERISEPADAVIARESDQADNGQEVPPVDTVNQQPKKPKEFSSELSAILTTLGAAVGTGNIWRFPRILARNTTDGGGLLFVLRKRFHSTYRNTRGEYFELY